MKKILIFGAGDGGLEILKIIIEDINHVAATWEVVGFVDADPKKEGTRSCGYPVFSDGFDGDPEDVYAICGLMNNTIRSQIIADEIENKGFRLASLVHPSAIVPKDFTAPPGLVVFPGVKISYSVKVGKGVILGYNAVLGHDLTIGDYSFLGPSVTIPGGCQVGDSCLIGAGAVLVPGVVVEDQAVVGAGTTVFANVAASTSVTDLPRKMTTPVRE